MTNLSTIRHAITPDFLSALDTDAICFDLAVACAADYWLDLSAVAVEPDAWDAGLCVCGVDITLPSETVCPDGRVVQFLPTCVDF